MNYSKTPPRVKHYAAYTIRRAGVVVKARTNPSGAVAILKALETVAKRGRK